jgi:hypothetical protein
MRLCDDLTDDDCDGSPDSPGSLDVASLDNDCDDLDEPHPTWCGCDDCLGPAEPCTVPGCGHPDPCDDCARAGGWF